MAFDVPGALFSKTIIEPKSVSSWHRHGERQLLGYVLSGCLRLECAESSVEVASGDFFRIPVGLIHRDVNPEASSSAVIVNLLLGEGEIVVNVGSQSG
jgi:quercetin dioxygenase-like cupin family protein